MRLNASVLTAVALGISATALAQDTQPLALIGDYDFETAEEVGGRPVCTETWSFSEGGQMLVASGEERVTKSYRFEHDRIGHWLVSASVSTNGLPDCMGNRTPSVSNEERRTYLLPFNSGIILVCPEPARLEDGSPFINACYASLAARPPR
jgi:hypothetical protein